MNEKKDFLTIRTVKRMGNVRERKSKMNLLLYLEIDFGLVSNPISKLVSDLVSS